MNVLQICCMESIYGIQKNEEIQLLQSASKQKWSIRAQNQLVIYLKDHEVHNAYENMLFPAYNVVLAHNLHPSTL